MTHSLLVVCPTRNRPERCRQMLDSFDRTSNPATQITCYVANDDPKLTEYKSLALLFGVNRFEFGPWLSMPDVFNRYFAATDYDYYSVGNDDFIYRTPGWDALLVAEIERHGGLGMAYGRPNGVLPDSAVWSARSLRALGWWMPPGFIHQHVDVVHADLFATLGQGYRVEEVWTEHVHPAFGTADVDEGYMKIYWGPDAEKDRVAYLQWRANQREKDLANLRKASELVPA